MNLEDIRKDIDAVDAQLLPLLVKRMKLSGEVAAYKHSTGMPVLNTAREAEILERVEEQGEEFGGACSVVFSTIMGVSRALQHGLLGGGEELRRDINEALSDTSHFTPSIVACQGVPGAYSGAAANELYPNARTDFYEHFEDVFKAVENGEADYGIIPVENSSAGSVHEAYDLIIKYRFSIAGALELPISHCLAAPKGASFKSIKKVYSHPQGLAQCKDFINAHSLTAVSCTNTAVAAEKVAERADISCAAIASKQAAELYGLEVLQENIQTSRNNVTRFIAISKKMRIPENADKISVLFSLPHKTGSLYSTLSRFAVCRLNLTKLESRPIKGKNFQYYFYLDFTGCVRDKETVNLLCALYDELPAFSFLGNFHEDVINRNEDDK